MACGALGSTSGHSSSARGDREAQSLLSCFVALLGPSGGLRCDAGAARACVCVRKRLVGGARGGRCGCTFRGGVAAAAVAVAAVTMCCALLLLRSGPGFAQLSGPVCCCACAFRSALVAAEGRSGESAKASGGKGLCKEAGTLL